MIGNKKPHQFGAIQIYATFLPKELIEVNGRMMKQTMIDDAECKRKRELVHEWTSLWAYEAAIPSSHSLMVLSFGNV